MGSSLNVQPVALIPELISKMCPNTPQILLNRELVSEPNQWDFCFLDDCDKSVKVLCDSLGWTQEAEFIPHALVNGKQKTVTKSKNNRKRKATDNKKSLKVNRCCEQLVI